MSCAEIIPKLELMADDELTSEQAAQTLSHIDDCSACRDHWYGILNLRQAIKDRAASFKPSTDFEERLIAAIHKEAWQAKAGQRKQPLLLYAAAILLLGLAATFLYTVANDKGSGSDKTVIGSASKAAGTPKLQTDAPQLLASNPVSLEDALDNFKQYLQKPGVTGSSATSQSDLSTISSQAGFTVKAMQLSGFKLAGAEMVASAPGKTNMVRLRYTRTKGKGQDSIICYQAAAGKLIAKGLNEHIIDGKKICCGQVEDKSIVFIPGQNGHANEVLLVGTISKSDLMDLVLSSG